MEDKIKPGTPLKGWKNTKTGEIKTYKEWIKKTMSEESLNENDAGIIVSLKTFKHELIPIV